MFTRSFLFLCLLFGALHPTPTLNQEQELELLIQSVKDHPEDPDLIYHLASAYQKLNRFLEAIDCFKKRLKKQEDPAQIGASKYQLAQCYEQINQWSDALYWYLEAYQALPSKQDPLLNIAVHYRQNGENDLAYIFAKHGSRFLPSKDPRFDQELSIVSYYTRFKEDGYKAASDLLIRKDVNDFLKAQAYHNLLFYVQNLKNSYFKPITINLPFICEDSEERYHPMNPSILKTENGYALICRTVNYTQVGAKEFNTIDPTGHFRTRNFLVQYDRDFHLLSQEEIVEDSLIKRQLSCNVLGLEDARIFEYNQTKWFTCTTRDNTIDGTPQISLCKLGNHGEVEKTVLLNGPDPYRCEKNWLPFVLDGVFLVVYSYDPFIVYKPDMDTGDCELEILYEPTHNFTQLRGSAGPIAFEDGYLILTHEVVLLENSHRCYLHRFLQLDSRFFVKQISKPFTFTHQGVEFCGSMTLNHEGTHLILPIGIEDRSALLCFVDTKTVKSLLNPLTPNL